MTIRFPKIFLLVTLGLFFIHIFLTSRSSFLDGLGSHYASYYSARSIKIKGLKLSMPLSVSFDSMDIGDTADKYRFRISQGEFSFKSLRGAISRPRWIRFSFQKIQMLSEILAQQNESPEMQNIRGYLVADGSNIKIKVRQAELGHIRLRGGALFTSGQLSKANIMGTSPRSATNYLGPISSYLKILKSDGTKPLQIKVIFTSDQIFLRGPKKPIASFSWSPN